MPRADLTKEQRETICEEYLAGASAGEIAEKWRVTRNTIMGIIARKGVKRPSGRLYVVRTVTRKKTTKGEPIGDPIVSRVRYNMEDRKRITLISIPCLEEEQKASAYSYKLPDRNFGT